MNVLDRLREDVQVVRDRDPAARNSALEVLLTTPGLHAQWFHRLAHRLHARRIPLVPRLVSQLARFLTGIEIHPGASIGRRFFIDHGMGVVIGETTEIGDDVSLYQGVTLGGTGKESGKRHPTLRDGCTIGVDALVLGAVTIGAGAKVGGGAVVLRDVPPGTTAVGVPAHIVGQARQAELDAGAAGRRLECLPDPEHEQLLALRREVLAMGTRIAALEQQVNEREREFAFHGPEPSPRHRAPGRM